jgi:hypothetical protein
MANLLSNPAAWIDGNGANPPVIWNGTLYDFTGYDGGVDSIQATAAEGDVVSLDLNNLAPSTVPGGFQVDVNGITVYGYDLHNVGTDTFTSAPLTAGDVVRVWSNVQYISSYVVDFTVTPINQAPLQAPDIALSVAMNSGPTSVTPTITQG